MGNDSIKYLQKYVTNAGADPGLFVGGSANSLGGGGTPTQYIYTFSEKPHEIKEILVRSRRPPPLNPPLQMFLLTISVLHYFPCTGY